MGASLQWSQVREQVTGKWQIPAFLASAAALVLSITNHRSPTDKIPFDEIRGALPSLIEQGQYTAAIESASRLFDAAGKTPQDLAAVHAAIGRARMLRAVNGGAVVPTIGAEAIKHYGQAVESGYELTAQDEELLSRAHDWNGDYEGAIAHFESARQKGGGSELELRLRAAELQADRLDAGPEVLQPLFDGIIRDASSRPNILVWALDRLIEMHCDAGAFDQARALLADAASQLKDDERRGWVEYLDAYVSFRAGGDDSELESRLRAMMAGLKLRDELYARTGWLLGRVVLGRDEPQRPQEAILIFRGVTPLEASPVYAAAGALGVAESLVLLERFDEALESYALVRDHITRLPPNPRLNPQVIETSLTVISDRLRQAGRPEVALQFAREATLVDAHANAAGRTTVLERLSDLLSVVADAQMTQADALLHRRSSPVAHKVNGNALPVALVETVSDGDRRSEARRLRASARALLLESAEVQLEIASLVTRDEDRAELAAWTAAERVHRTGDAVATVDAMKQFNESRPDSPYVSRALRYMGQAQQALGRHRDAIASFQENINRFGRTTDAGSSLIPLARCYMSLGPESAEIAERTLRLVLDNSEVFTPVAPEYADALYLLGDLLNRTGEYERAIPALEEAMTRYPRDERSARARFLLGDCYRQSGMSLKDEYEKATYSAQREQILADQKHRLRRAAELFAGTVALFESELGERLSRLDQVYLQHARLDEADCHFELNDYDRARRLYERTAWVYKGTATMLAAYVQIINCHVFKGESAEAEAALRRALYLVETMPEDAFADGVGIEKREDWRSYFEWIQKADLF